MEKEYSSDKTKEKAEGDVQNQTEKSSKDPSAILSRNKSSSDIATEATHKIILNKTSEDRTLEENNTTQNNINKTNQSEDKLIVTVRFEVKNNTSLLHVGNMHEEIKIKKKDSLKNLVENSTSDNLSMMNTTFIAKNSSKANDVENGTILVTASKETSWITSSSTTTTNSSSSILVSNVTATTPSTVNNTVNTKTGQNSGEIEKENPTQRSEMFNISKVTNMQLMTSVTPSVLNSTVQSLSKVSSSFNISDTSTVTEIDETGSTNYQPELSSISTDQANSKTTTLRRLKRSNGQKKLQAKKKKNFVKSSRNHRLSSYLCYLLCQDKVVLAFIKYFKHKQR